MFPSYSKAILLLCLSATFTLRAATDFSKEVYPVLQRACFECHGPEMQKAGLRLDARDHFLNPSKSGKPVIMQGKPAESELLRRIQLPKTDGEAMPKRGTRLKPAEIEAIRSWIAEGAVWPESINTAKHWAYIPPVKSPSPAVNDAAWPRQEMDRHILARLEAEGIRPSPEAEKSVLLRRVTLDLTGVPPTVQEVDAFLADSSATAYEKAVERLLRSEEFGVRWARPWLDLARYADSHGFQRDDLREVWAYRDWVVKALNADMPFDQFTIEQVAGDLLPGATPDQIVATGFHRCTPTNVEAGTDPEESRVNQVLDRVNTTGAVWLGTTLECAQCHNHKYDPFTSRDYYQLVAYFNNTQKEAERADEKVPGSIAFRGVGFALPDEKRAAERAKAQADLRAVEASIVAYKKSKPAAAPTHAATTPLAITGFISEGGAESELQKDKSLLVNGDLPDTDIYVVDAAISGKQITALKLEALQHPSLPGKGPGRGDPVRTNFVLNEFEATLKTPDGKEQRLKFTDAHASHSQTNWDVHGAVDGKPNTGWAIAPKFEESHWAVFTLATPLDIPEGSSLEVRLSQQFRGGRTIGCLRLSSMRGTAQESLAAASPPNTESVVPTTRRSRKAKAAKPVVFSTDPQLAKLEREKVSIEKRLAATAPATTEVMREMEQPRKSTMFKRGLFTDPGEPVQPGTPEILPQPSSPQRNRLDLARWLVSRENPLTARVQVNRVWHEVFGQGIVTTVEDFGIKGERPSHPALLDMLAVDFMEQGWSLKKLLRTIVTSATYRQSSALVAASAAKDPLNTLLWRGPRFRLDAEAIRDNALAISGLLSTQKGGPSIRPPQPDDLWKKVGGENYPYVVSPGEMQYRRGIYVVLKRGSPYPSFMNFDGSARMACVVRRSRSNTPLQALTLLNDPVYVQATEAFAKRMMSEIKSADPEKRIRHGFKLALAREPCEQELAVLKNLYQSKANDPVVALKQVAAAILNLDETITKS